VRLGHFNWHAGVLSHRAAPVTLGVPMILPRRPQPVSRKISQWCAYRGMDRTKARMTDDPGNSNQAATIRPAQGLRVAGEVRILGRWKYFERYSEKGRVPVVRTPSSFIPASRNSERCNMTGNEDHVGFLASGSGLQQFQLSSGGWFILQCRRFSARLKLTNHTSNLFGLQSLRKDPAACCNWKPTQTSQAPWSVPVPIEPREPAHRQHPRRLQPSAGPGAEIVALA
jgi:hypothetical protein